MKTPALILIAVICALFGSALTGCKTGPEDAAFKTIGVIDITAVNAMNGWLDYKNTHTVPPEQVAKVKAAWDKFYSANQVARAAVIQFKANPDAGVLNNAIAAVNAAQADVISIILQFLPPAKAAALKGVSP